MGEVWAVNDVIALNILNKLDSTDCFCVIWKD